MSIAYFKISFTSVILFTLFTDNISYHFCNLQLSFINKYYLQNFQQYHKKTAASTSEERYDWYDVCITLFHLWPFLSVYLRDKIFLKIVLLAYDLTLLNFIIIYIYIGEFIMSEIYKRNCSCFTELILVLLLYWVNFGYIWYLTSDWSRNSVLAILLSWCCVQ